MKILNGMTIRTDDGSEGIVRGHGWKNRKQTIGYETLDKPSNPRLCYRYQVTEFQSKNGDWIPYREIREKHLSISQNR
ncbi:hypothetical protein J2W98_003761 [Paenibacillus peoriae]|uniref:Uncharacterized protein n=1 Tax=Paenibacillus peoriae TaxID=59893 RepID=A0ABU1QIK5_9BACL|nr:hypothetical protein [Paenibacillus peoriae]MDR6779481.1 hypothetical protein [Paenibacillus peoriae]